MKQFIYSIKEFLFKTKLRKVIFFTALALFSYSRVNAYLKPDFELDLITVDSETFVEKVSASGEVRAEKAINLVFQSAGDITDIAVGDGSFVKKGQAIATVDSTIAYQTYLQAQADLRAKEASLDVVYDAVKDHDDDESLAQKESRTLAETAKDKSYRGLVAAQKALGNSTLVAPFEGILNYVKGVSVGSYASAVSPSFTLVDPDTIYFQAEVSEVEVSRIKLGTEAHIQLDAYPTEEYIEKVGMIGFSDVTTSTGGTAYTIKVSLPTNSDNKFRLGMNGDIDFVISEQNGVLSVPFSALVEESSDQFVWVVRDNGKVTKTKVETGTSSLDSIEIISGLQIGAVIVERPPNTLEEGNKVKQK